MVHAQYPVVIRPFGYDEEAVKKSADADRLFNLGYGEVFNRKFTAWSLFCLNFSALGLLSSMSAVLGFCLMFISVSRLLIVGMLDLED